MLYKWLHQIPINELLFLLLEATFRPVLRGANGRLLMNLATRHTIHSRQRFSPFASFNILVQGLARCIRSVRRCQSSALSDDLHLI